MKCTMNHYVYDVLQIFDPGHSMTHLWHKTDLCRHFRHRSKCNLTGKLSLLQLLFHQSRGYRYWTRTSVLPFWRGSIELRPGTLCINALLSTKEEVALHIVALQAISVETHWIISFLFFSLPFLYFWVREWMVWVSNRNILKWFQLLML